MAHYEAATMAYYEATPQSEAPVPQTEAPAPQPQPPPSTSSKNNGPPVARVDEESWDQLIKQLPEESRKVLKGWKAFPHQLLALKHCYDYIQWMNMMEGFIWPINYEEVLSYGVGHNTTGQLCTFPFRFVSFSFCNLIGC